ncbi:hypothetical protein CHARACLAT_015092 [Characodon lateralis]|uniref:Uncharacterized protein n=1 Tax=Characodon lateralis TaxID=208331 RepID=A0ABU7DAK1_9TELE|nr:hypothetical protein [Characodon lateralis]
MEYLYSQSGQSLTVMNNPEEEDRLVEQLDDEAVNDEGFVEEELVDLTVPVLYEPFGTVPLHSSIPQASNHSSSAPSSPQPSITSQGLPPLQQPAEPSGASSPVTSAGCSVAHQAPAPVLGPDGIPGWDKVQDLAEYLMSLRQALYLDEQ